MSEKILVVGGVALGPKAACRCKRLMPDAEVMLVDENVFISYGGCGIPYYVSGEIQNLDDLRSTPAGHVTVVSWALCARLRPACPPSRKGQRPYRGPR